MCYRDLITSSLAVVAWVLVVSACSGTTPVPDDTKPSFEGKPSFKGTVADQSYLVGEPIEALTLPAAAGGNGELAYALQPDVPGLTFDGQIRVLSGTPAELGTYNMTYTAVDADDNTDASDGASLLFTITVNEDNVDLAVRACSNGAAVASAAANPGLVADCVVLLTAKRALTDTGTTEKLNWSPSVAMDRWDGLTLGGVPRRVTEIILQGYALGGSILAILGQLSHLETLVLNLNQLAASIPAELGQMAHLRVLSLWGNRLSGWIPTDLAKLTRLEILYLAQNELTGSIPAELGRLTNLNHLHLRINRLSGSIPEELGNLANLTWLNLGWNQLTGAIPEELGRLIHLEWLFLQQNQLTGAIPEQLGQLHSLTQLYLRDNQLSGPFPSELGMLTNLTILNIALNPDLSGCVPANLRRNLTFVPTGDGVSDLGVLIFCME